jgi:hypothetical protein
LMPSRIRINATTFAYPNLPRNPDSTQPKSALTMIQETELSVSEVVAFTAKDLRGPISPKLNVFTPGGDGAVLRGYTVVKN